MASWDLAERVIDASSSGCRENLQKALQQSAAVSSACRAEIGRVLRDASSPGENQLRPEAIHSGTRDDSKASKHKDTSNADSTVTIVFTFVGCVLVAVAGFAYCVGGGRTLGGRQMRGGRRLPKKCDTV
eukprot:g8825.t1